jgi:argininosuccinate lyase
MTLWGGRFEAEPDQGMKRWGDSIGFDIRLYGVDVRGSLAYAEALQRAGVITADERDQLAEGLGRVREEFLSGSFELQAGDEDIHTAVERRLGELIGPVAGKLHTGRSRNDQVATDLRLYLLEQIDVLRVRLRDLQRAIVEKADAEIDVIMPGYTHLQQAQPVLFSHWLMAGFWKLQRDVERLGDAEKRTAACPLGSGALAGNPLGIDRAKLAAELGFERACENSIDGVADRDFVIEFLAWAALVQVHLSSLAEDLIIWASREFGFVSLDEAYSTGSSLMPQKKNPDSLELVRARAGRVVGHLTGMLTTLKGLPSSYNKDLQEDKEPLFDTIDTLKLELPLVAGVIRTLTVNSERMAGALDEGLLATDLADYLVGKGVPFRQAHRVVGHLVRKAEELGVSLKELEPDQYRAADGSFGEDVQEVFDYRRAVAARSAVGGTAPESVRAQIEAARGLLGADA